MNKIIAKMPVSAEKTFLSSSKGVVILATFACFLWGSAFPALKYSYDILGLKNVHFSYDLQFAGYRFFLASIIVLAFIAVKRMNLKISASDIPRVMFLGLMQTTILYFFFYVGLSNTSGVKGSIISSTGTFFAVVMPHFIYKNDRMNTRKALGLSLGLIGVVMISIAKGPMSPGFKLTGEGYLILSSLVSAISTIYGKELTNRINPVVMNFYSLLFGSIVMIAASFIFTGKNVIPITPSFAPMMIYLSFLSGAAFTLWYMILQVNKVSTVVIHKFQIPVWGALLSAILIKGEVLSFYSVVALVLVCIGIVLVSVDINLYSRSRT